MIQLINSVPVSTLYELTHDKLISIGQFNGYHTYKISSFNKRYIDTSLSYVRRRRTHDSFQKAAKYANKPRRDCMDFHKLDYYDNTGFGQFVEDIYYQYDKDDYDI